MISDRDVATCGHRKATGCVPLEVSSRFDVQTRKCAIVKPAITSFIAAEPIFVQPPIVQHRADAPRQTDFSRDRRLVCSLGRQPKFVGETIPTASVGH